MIIKARGNTYIRTVAGILISEKDMPCLPFFMANFMAKMI